MSNYISSVDGALIEAQSYTRDAVSPEPQQPLPMRPRKRRSYRASLSFGVVLAALGFLVGSAFPVVNLVSSSISTVADSPPVIPGEINEDDEPTVIEPFSDTELGVALWVASVVSEEVSSLIEPDELNDTIAAATLLLESEDGSSEDIAGATQALNYHSTIARTEARVVEVRQIAERSRDAIASNSLSLGGDRRDDVLNMLKILGASDVGVVYNSPPCGLDEAAACVSSVDPTFMTLDEQILDKNYFEDYQLFHTIAHELAHTVHFRAGYNRVFEIPSVGNLFADDPEYLADCMAQDITGEDFTTYGYTCTSEQIDAAREVWHLPFW